jgi:DNA recombination protein RmuC
MIVKLPNTRCIVVDSKAPLQAFLDATETTDEEQRKVLLATFSANVRAHLNKLSAKNYWDQFEHAPDFVVMFLPGEHLFSAALNQDPQLIEAGVHAKVLIATPTTLIALLRTVAFGWKQEKLAANAQAISELGKNLYDRLRSMSEHLGKMGKSIGTTVEAYNATVGSFETRVLVSARKFDELGAGVGKEIQILEPCDLQVRQVRAIETSAVRLIGTDEMPPPVV